MAITIRIIHSPGALALGLFYLLPASKHSDSAFTNLRQRFDYPYDILLRIAKGHQQILGS